MLQSLRYAVRRLRKNPGFSMVSILTLALGIGSTTAMFSVVNAILLRPLPFPQSGRLYWIQYDDAAAGGNGSGTFSYPNFFDLRDRQRSFSGIASYRNSGTTLIGEGQARQLRGEIVSSEFFRVLGVAPLAGRDFTAHDEARGVRTVMLSWDFWQRTFAGRRDLIGASINLDGGSYEVAGVMPPGFSFPIQSPPPDLWISLAEDFRAGSIGQQRGAGFLNLIGRLRPGQPLPTAEAGLQVIAGALASAYPEDDRLLTRIIVTPQLEHMIGDTRAPMRILFAAVAAVLLIGCVNVAGLLLARVSRRRAEAGIMAALGAGRWTIVRQLMLESVCLSMCGGALGVLLSTWIVEALRRVLPASVPRFESVSIDAGVLIFAAAVSVATGMLFGLLPALRLSTVEPFSALRDGNRAVTGRARLQSWLVVAETAIGLVLLVGSGLLVRSFLRVLAVNPGFDARRVLTVDMSVPNTRYSDETRLRLYRALLARLTALPGVQSVAAGWPMPLSAQDVNIEFEIQGRPKNPGEELDEHLGVATPGFFAAMRIPLLAGRAFNASDDANGAGVMIVNEAFARKYFPGRSAVGRHIRAGISDGHFKGVFREVVGVVGSVKRSGLTADMDPQYYLPWAQAVITWPTIVVRTSNDPSNLAGAIRAAVADIDRGIPVFRIATMETIVSKAAAEPRFQTLLLTSFAVMALLLAAVGLYAVLSCMVAQRAREIGVRMALGARRGDVLRLILRRGAVMSLGGIALGLLASAALTRQMSGMLYGIRPLDPATLSAVSAILLAVSLAASLIPSYRAARLDPMRVLRDQ